MNALLLSLSSVADTLSGPVPLLLAKVTVLLAVAWLLHAALARSNPRWRVLVWGMTAAGIVLVGALALCPPLLTWAALPPEPQQAADIHPPVLSAAGPAQADSRFTAAEMTKPAGRTRAEEFDAVRIRPSAEASDARNNAVEKPVVPIDVPLLHSGRLSRPDEPVTASNRSAGTEASAPAAAEKPSETSFDAAWLVWIWLAGVVLTGLRSVIGVARLRRIRALAERVPAEVESQAQQIATALQIKPQFAVQQIDAVASPCLAGLLRPVILLPRSEVEGSADDELTPILAHELAHLKGRDLIWNAVLHGIEIVLWFHPLMWRVRRAHADACDAVCDALAADYLGDATRYGQVLARLALRIAAPTANVGLAMARTSHVRQRIEAVRRHIFRTGLSRRSVVGALLAAAVSVVSLGGLALTHSVAAPSTTVGPAQPADSGSIAIEAPNKAGDPNASDTPVHFAAVEEPRKAEAAKPESTSQPAEGAERLEVSVMVDKTGKPVEGARVEFHGRIDGRIINENLRTDAQGVAGFNRKAGAKVGNLWMTVKGPRLVPQHYTWRPDRGEIKLPERIDLRLEPGIRIGGVVKDEKGQPIAGATVEATMPVTWPKLANYVFTAMTIKTDENGHWQWNAAPAGAEGVGLSVTHPDYLRGGTGAKPHADHFVVLKQGLHVAGRVVDSEGKPITGASARLGFDRFGTNEPAAKTDADGRFVLKNCKAGKSLVTVQAEGFSPTFQELVVGEHKELEFRLEAGHTLRVRVVDIKGQPVPGVWVGSDTWRGYRSLLLESRTDADGRIAWTSAPADPMLCDILKAGYMSIRRKPLKAGDEEQVITIPAELVVTGRVTDKTTGKPIAKFALKTGHLFSDGDRVSWSRDEPIPFQNGTYQLKTDDPYKQVLQVVADGYRPLVSRTFDYTEGAQTFDFQLEPQTESGPSGVVLLPSGEPAVGADVLLATRESRVSLRAGRVDRSQNNAEVVKTDSAGRFRFAPRPDDDTFLLVAVHEQGYADAFDKEFEKDKQLQLQAWARIEGQVLEGDKPDANREVSFDPKERDSRRTFLYVWTLGYETKTDAQGRFKLERVIPGQGRMYRVVVTEFLKSWQHAPCWQTPVDVPAGKVAQVTIGGTGRPVIGRLVLDRQPDVSVDWTTNEPATIERWDEDKDQRDRSYARYAANISKTGEFRIPDVPAGRYRLSVPVNNPPTPNACGAGTAIGRAELKFTIPEIPGGRSEEPVDLSIIEAKLYDTLDVGEIAPDFVAQRLDGGTFKMRDLKGKLVLLDFWATWCQPCVAEMPQFNEIHRQFAADPRFVLLSLSCDNEPGPAKKFVEANGYNWQHANVGGTTSRVPQQYTVRALPATFLIAPNGRVLAKNLKGEELQSAIAAALGDARLFSGTDERPPRFPVLRFEPPREPRTLSGKPAVLVLDNTDETYEKDQPHSDVLRLLTSADEELWSHSNLNVSETVGGAHRMALDRSRGRIYVCENNSNRVTAFDLHGSKVWQVEQIDADCLAVDETTGNLWCSGGSRLNEGETVVLDPQGNEVAVYPYRGVDIAFDPHSDSIWLVGYELIKLSRSGEVRFRKKTEGWCCVSVSMNPQDGSLWIAERNHPDVARSRNRLWLLNSDGTPRRTIDLGENDPFVVAGDPRTGDAWFSGYNTGLRRATPEGKVSEPSDSIAWSLAISPTTGDVWAGTNEAVVKLDATGKALAQSPFRKKSTQSWLLAF